jgi:hypothetical protein
VALAAPVIPAVLESLPAVRTQAERTARRAPTRAARLRVATVAEEAKLERPVRAANLPVARVGAPKVKCSASHEVEVHARLSPLTAGSRTVCHLCQSGGLCRLSQ